MTTHNHDIENEPDANGWRLAEFSKAVGKKKYLFYTNKKEWVIGYRISGTSSVICEHGVVTATHFKHLDMPVTTKAGE